MVAKEVIKNQEALTGAIAAPSGNAPEIPIGGFPGI